MGIHPNQSGFLAVAGDAGKESGKRAADYGTLRLLETVRYDQVFAAAYSERPGTPATRLPDDVPPAEKRRRLVELLLRPFDLLGREVRAAGEARHVVALGWDPE